MKKDGIRSPEVLKLIRLSGAIVPIYYLIYGFLVYYHIATPKTSFNPELYYLLGFLWICFTISTFFSKFFRKSQLVIWLASLHVLAAFTLFFIADINTPFSILWIVLVLYAYSFFGNRGGRLSLAFFFGLIVYDLIIHHKDLTSPNKIIADISVFIGLLIAAKLLQKVHDNRSLKLDSLNYAQRSDVVDRDRFTTIINNMSEAVIHLDRHGFIKIYNAATLSLLDTNVSLQDKLISSVIHLKDGEGKTFSFLRALHAATGSVTRDDLTMEIDEDEVMRIEATYTPIRSSYTTSQHTDAHDGYIVILRDVTKVKSLEEERDEFISVVSHELRTPITVIEGELSNLLLLMQHPDVSQTMKVDAIKSAHEHIIYLANMVNDLSTLSRAERGVADSAEDIDVQEMIHKFYEEYEPEAKKKKLHLNLDMSSKVGHVSASRLYLEELLQNFITNGIKYTQTGHVDIIVKESDGNVIFSVKDSGIGISKSDQARIFEKFFRSEDYRTRETSGTGLGLYVAKKLAHKLGTHIEMTSRLNHGSTFSISLPVKTDVVIDK